MYDPHQIRDLEQFIDFDAEKRACRWCLVTAAEVLTIVFLFYIGLKVGG